MVKYLIPHSKFKKTLYDHGLGFDINLKNQFLDTISGSCDVQLTYIVNDAIRKNYPHINFKFDYIFSKKLLARFDKHIINPKKETITNFLCSFNGTPHVSRQFLTSSLYKFGWFNRQYCSKNFVTSRDCVDGNIESYCDKQLTRVYRKFIIDESATAENFYNTIHGFNYTRYDHSSNIQFLEKQLTESFVHIVSETMATSYYPFVTEKFLYSIVTRGLFVAYAQPNWHNYLEQYYGFKKYTRLFDYKFDSIENPVIRLVELMSMISKFSILSPYEWHDLYLMEYDTIEYNRDHYYSQQYLTQLKKYAG